MWSTLLQGRKGKCTCIISVLIRAILFPKSLLKRTYISIILCFTSPPSRPHRRSTTVSSESNPLLYFNQLCDMLLLQTTNECRVIVLAVSKDRLRGIEHSVQNAL